MVNSVIAFLNKPLPAQLQMSLDLHESGKWVAALLSIVAVAVSLAHSKVLRAKGSSGGSLVRWALGCGLLSFLATQGYIYLVDSVTTPGLLWDRIQTGVWSSMFAFAAACFVFVIQAIAAAGTGTADAQDDVEPKKAVDNG